MVERVGPQSAADQAQPRVLKRYELPFIPLDGDVFGWNRVREPALTSLKGCSRRVHE
jgi:hypothetical protein